MKKFLSILCLPLLLCIFLVSCSSKSNSTSLEKSQFKNTLPSNNDVTLTIKETEITTSIDEITLIFTNNSSNEYTYGLEQFLEIQIDDQWYSVPSLEGMAWNEIAYILSPNSSSESTFLLKRFYGNLKEGHYRIVKKLFSDSDPIELAVEFDIK